MTTILAIDPGYASGAVALVGPDDAIVYDMPIIEKHGIDGRELYAILGARWLDHCFIERVAAMPGQGVASTFKFGMGFGQIVAAVQIARIPYTFVTPAKWKAYHRLPKDKDAARARALQLFPGLSDQLKRKKDADRAEALLIAQYGVETWKGRPMAAE